MVAKRGQVERNNKPWPAELAEGTTALQVVKFLVSGLRQQRVQFALVIQLQHIGITTDVVITDENLWYRHSSIASSEHFLARLNFCVDAYFTVLNLFFIEHFLGPGTVGAKPAAVDDDLSHFSFSCSFLTLSWM
jgi:hypothetical protein